MDLYGQNNENFKMSSSISLKIPEKWEDISKIEGAEFLDIGDNANENKKNIFEVFFGGDDEFVDFSTRSLILPNDKMMSLLETKIFDLFFYKNKNVINFTFDSDVFTMETNKKIMNKFKRSSISSLWFKNLHDIDPSFIGSLVSLIKRSENINCVFFHNCSIGKSHIKKLSKLIEGNESLESIGFSICENIDNSCIDDLIDISKNTLIQTIDLGDIVLTDHNLSRLQLSLFENFIKNGNTEFEFDEENINDDTLKNMGNIIVNNDYNTIETINLRKNRITNKGFVDFIDSLLSVGSEDVVSINFSSNELGDDCVDKLKELIDDNYETMEEIFLDDINLSNEGVEKLSKCICGNTRIETLSLSSNIGINNDSEQILKNMVKSSYIKQIILHGTSLSENIITEIEALANIENQYRDIPLLTNDNDNSHSKKMKE